MLTESGKLLVAYKSYGGGTAYVMTPPSDTVSSFTGTFIRSNAKRFDAEEAVRICLITDGFWTEPA